MRVPIVLLSAAALGGCGSPLGAANADVVPFVARDAGPLPAYYSEGARYDEQPAPQGLAACRQEDLDLVLERAQPALLRTTVSARRECALPGGTLEVSSGTAAGSATTTSRALRPGGVSHHFTRWGSACEGQREVRLRFTVGTWSVTTPAAPAPACTSPGGALIPTPWRAVEYDPQPPARQPFDDLDQSLDGFTTRDGVAHVQLVLDNATDRDVPLDPCPVVGLSAGEGGTGTGARYLLNCADAPAAVPAGGQLRFALELPLGDAFGPPPTTLVPEPDQDYQGYGFSARLESVHTDEQDHARTGFPVRVA